MDGNLSMAATTPAQRPIPAPETMKDAGMPNAGAIQTVVRTRTSTNRYIRLTAQRLSAKHDQEHGSEVPHKGPLLDLLDRRILRCGFLCNMLLMQLLPDLPQRDARPECRGDVKG